MYMSYADKGEAGTGKAAAIALPICAGIGGYFAGRAIDKVTTTIVIQP
jgi:hypothetical protein